MMTAKLLTDLLGQTMQQPQVAARGVLGLPLSRAERWQALVLVVVLSVILTQLAVFLAPADEGRMISDMLGSPIHSGIIQTIVLVVMAFAIHLVGRAMGGQGDLDGAVLVVVWLELVMLCLQVVQMLLGTALPFLAPVIGLFGVVLFFWLLTQFSLVLHGFRSPLKVFVMILIALFGLAFLLAVAFALLGFSLPGGA